jgi:hypothetical protein
MATFSSDIFFFHKDTNTFSVDMSQLDEGGTSPVWEAAYNDACDEGFKMVSSKTGQSVMYVVEQIDKNADQEIQGWHLIPTAESIRRVPACKGTKILVVNT